MPRSLYFFGMARLLAIGAAISLLACHPAAAAPAAQKVPGLGRAEAAKIMLRADDLRRLVLESGDSTNLADAFARSALKRLQSESHSMAMRRLSEEERTSSRDLVFWDPLAQEAVLQVVAERRLVTPEQPNPPWSSTIRQWWARMESVEGSWKVVEQGDLPPDRWRPVAPAA